MDCEMVGVGQGNKSALGRVTLVNRWGNVVYDEFVRPAERVVDFRTEISGIRPRDLRKAKDFRLVQKKVAELIKGRILVDHALRNDLKALLLSHPKEDIRDTLEYEPFMRGEGSRRALRHLAAEFLDVKIQNREHCPECRISISKLPLKCDKAYRSKGTTLYNLTFYRDISFPCSYRIEDARAAMVLCQKNRKAWEKRVKDQIKLKQKQKKRKPKRKRANGDEWETDDAETVS